MSRSRIRRVRPGGQMSAASYNELAGAVEHQREGRIGGMRRSGDATFAPEHIGDIPELAIITDDRARPIDAETPYIVALVGVDGVAVPGSAFDAWEVSGDRTVPDGTLIQVFPVEGEWGFLWRRVLILAQAAENFTTIDEAAPDANVDGTNWRNWDIYKDSSAGDERRALIRSDYLLGTSGVGRIRAMTFDILDSLIALTGMFNPPPGVGGTADYYLTVRSIQEDWTPEDVTWNDVAGLDKGDSISCHIKNFTAGPSASFSDRNLEWSISPYNDDVDAATWGNEAEIYGFVVAFGNPGTAEMTTWSQRWWVNPNDLANSLVLGLRV